ncbi:beta-lactamase family protein [Streptomycetaceae bacterium NBC_01309]
MSATQRSADLRPGGAFDTFLAEQAAKDEFSGTVLLTHRGHTVLSRAFGMADKRLSIRNRTDTLFAMASASKLFTAVAVHQLARAGAVQYHERLGAYVGGLPSTIADVTVHQLLTHTSGVADYRRTPGFDELVGTWTTEAAVNDGTMALIREAGQSFAPGTRFEYTSSGYELLGALVAQVSRRSYYDFAREYIFRPAGMTSTDWYTRTQWSRDPRFAHPYARQPSGERVDVVASTAFIGTAGGNAISNVRDLERFARAVTSGRLLGPAFTKTLLSGKHALRPWTDSRDNPPAPASQGYGPLSLLLGGQWVFLHNGSAPGEGAYVEIYPRTGWVSVVLGNYDAQTAAVPVAARARTLITAQRP